MTEILLTRTLSLNSINRLLHWESEVLNGPRREKTCLLGLRQSEFQTSLFSYRD